MAIRCTSSRLHRDRASPYMSNPLRCFLGSGETLARLQDHASRLRRLQTALESALATALPAQAIAQYRVGNLKDEHLVVFAQTAAAAVRLKQILPRLTEHLRMAGHSVQGIKVRILSPDAMPPPERPATQRKLSGASLDHLTDFAASLPADSELRSAIERLARRARTQ